MRDQKPRFFGGSAGLAAGGSGAFTEGETAGATGAGSNFGTDGDSPPVNTAAMAPTMP